MDQRAKRVELSVERGCSRQRGSFLGFGIAFILWSIVFAVMVLMDPESPPYWLLVFLGVALFVGIGVYMIREWLTTRWDWDANGITHTSGKRVTHLQWADITSAKWVIGGWRVTGPNGAVSCGHHVLGYNVISDALIKYRPDLAHATLLRA